MSTEPEQLPLELDKTVESEVVGTDTVLQVDSIRVGSTSNFNKEQSNGQVGE